jgi:hypothetical protein
MESDVRLVPTYIDVHYSDAAVNRGFSITSYRTNLHLARTVFQPQFLQVQHPTLLSIVEDMEGFASVTGVQSSYGRLAGNQRSVKAEP